MTSFSKSPFYLFVILSVLVHGAVIFSGFLGFLTFSKKPLVLPDPLPVEWVDLQEEQSKSKDPTPPKKVTKPPKKLESKPEKQEPVQEVKQPDSAPSPAVKPAVQKESLEKGVPDPDAPLLKNPPQKKPSFKNIKTLKAKAAAAKKSPQKKPKKKEKDFDALLKNLIQEDTTSKKGQGGELSDHMAASELDAVRKQIEDVWRLPAGVQGMHTKTIAVKITMKPDRMVLSARLVDASGFKDDAERILAESALRAVNEFKFQPLKLPPQKYKTWKEIILEFDPRHLF